MIFSDFSKTLTLITLTYGLLSAWPASHATAQTTPAATAVSAVRAEPDVVAGGGQTTLTVVLTQPAQSDTVVVLSTVSTAIQLPVSITIPGGQSQASVTVSATAVTTTTSVKVTATFNGTAKQALLTVLSESDVPTSRPPVFLSASLTTDKIQLKWLSPDEQTNNYKIYRSLQRGGPYQFIASVNTTTYLDDLVQGANRWFYVVTCVSHSKESVYSNEAEYTPLSASREPLFPELQTLPGASPFSALTFSWDQKFYGTTVAGGANDTGTIYSLSLPLLPTDYDAMRGYKLQTVYNFSPVNNVLQNLDGAAPDTSVTSVMTRYTAGGSAFPQPVVSTEPFALYGLTSDGGTTGSGTFFKLDGTGLSSVSKSATSSPVVMHVWGAKRMYGVTPSGGANGNGAIYAVDANGVTQVIYEFPKFDTFATNATGASPVSVMVGHEGALYGTTTRGGANGTGTIFRYYYDTLSVIHHFDALNDEGTNNDGLQCTGQLVDRTAWHPLAGNDFWLYGTASSGGTNNTGTIFKVHRDGRFAVLAQFPALGEQENPAANNSGAEPQDGLQDIPMPDVATAPTDVWTYLSAIQDTWLYGTTSSGGQYGFGTLYRVNINGELQTLHHFNNYDGASPYAHPSVAVVRLKSLIQGMPAAMRLSILNGTGTLSEQTIPSRIYGTTAAGGVYGRGTVYMYDIKTGQFSTIVHFTGKANK